MAIGTTLALAGASLAGAAITANAAGDAADAQVDAANSDIELQRAIYNETVERFNPFAQSGLRAQQALDYENGIGALPVFGGQALEIQTIPGTPAIAPTTTTTGGGGSSRDSGSWGGVSIRSAGSVSPTTTTTPGTAGTPATYQVGDQVFDTYAAAQEYATANGTQGTAYRGYTETPGYQYQLQQGVNALDSSAASRGQLYSGATMQSQTQFGQDIGSSYYNDYLARLASQAASGQNAAGLQASAAQNYANSSSNAFSAIGNANSAASVATGNAISGGLSNIGNIFAYQNAMNNGSIGGGALY